MADTQSAQPTQDPIFDRLEHSLELWREHLTRLGPSLQANEMHKLSRHWDQLRQSFDVACLQNGIEIPGLEAALDPLPILRDLNQDELEMTYEALLTAKKTLTSMLAETQSRVGLLEDSLNTGRPVRIRKNLEKLRAIDEVLQTRLLGLDAYIEQFKLAEIEGFDLLQSTQKIIEQTTKIDELTRTNAGLEAQATQMGKWLSESKLILARMPASPPPSPSAMQRLSLSRADSNEVDKALMALFSSHEKLKEARLYLEDFLAERGSGHE